MKKLLLSLISIGLVGASAFGLTQAFFSDTETSSGNLLSAGKLDLLIDNISYYNHATSSATTWGLKDLTSNDLFLNFTDIKPGDEGEDTISIHVDNNDAWACMDMTFTKDDDISCTEPEQLDDPSCSESDSDLFDGELGSLVHFIFWSDDGDNVLEDGEPILASGSAKTVLDTDIVLADASANNVGGSPGSPLAGGQTYYIGKAWCFGTLTPNPVPGNGGVDPTVDSGIICNGVSLNNAAQTDALMADISFSAVQSRHNPNFLCFPTPTVTVTPTPSNTPNPTPTPTPTPPEGIANHVVISEVQIRGSNANQDFVEMYNPTSLSVNLNNWQIKKKTSNGTISSLVFIGIGKTIPAHGFFLWANNQGGFNTTVGADVSNGNNLSENNSIALEDQTDVIIDQVGWGNGINQFLEGSIFQSNPDVNANQSIERKALSTSTAASMAIGGTDEFKGNGFDLNVNSTDFVLRTVSQPQNSGSAAESP